MGSLGSKMKKLLMLTMLMPTLALAQVTGNVYPITRVIDGDTVEIQANFLPAPLKPVLSVRIYGVDTPEKGFRAGCPEEAAKGEAATAYTKKLVAASHKQTVIIMSWDKYGGRVLGDINLDGMSLRKSLIDNGFAREYYGDKKQTWCN
jgi:endonuclease YncB( thermonuclease family)